MYNIKIKSVPNKAKTGSQLDYSLVDRNTLFLKPNTPVNSDVKNTIGAVPRDKANIEAEGGETVVGDINNDGFLEHQTIVGKRHSQGGVPLNVPEGSFIFSDTKKMMIKDPEVLSIFGMKPNKAGYTPAEIAKKYNINDYIAILKDPAKDKYSKETAQIMLDSNLKKLGMLALIQESMKGFPDGVPAIAESIMGQMMGGQESYEQEQAEGSQEPQEEMQEPMQQRYGGELPEAQMGKNKKTQTVKYVPEEYDYSLWGDIKRSFKSNLDNVSKKGLATHLQEWWNEKDDSDNKKVVVKQKTVQKNKTAEKSSPSVFNDFLSIGKAQMEPWKGSAAALANFEKEKKKRDYDKYVKKIEQEKREKEKRQKDDIAERKKALTPKVPGAIPKIGDYYFVNGQYVKIADIEMDTAGDILPDWINNPSGVYFSKDGTTDYTDKNKKYYLSFDDFKKLTADPKAVVKKQGRTASSWWTADDNRAYNFSGVPQKIPSRTYNDKTYNQGDIIKAGDDNTIEILNPQYGVGEKNPLLNPKRFVGIGDQYNETMIVRARDKNGNIVYDNYPLRLDELDKLINSGFAKNMSEQKTNTSTAFTNTGGVKIGKDTYDKKETAPVVQPEKESTPVVTSKDKVGKVYETPRSIKKPVPVAPVQNNTQSPFIIDTSEEEYAYGGSINKMQTGGGTPRFNSVTGMYQNYDANGKPVGAPYKGAGTTYNVRDADLIEKAKAAGYEVIGNKYAPKVTYIPEQTSKTGFQWNPESGYYENAQFPIGKQGLEETLNIWKDELEQYQGPSGKGVEAWRKDFLNQKGQKGPASEYLVNKANEYSVAAGVGPQVDVTQKAAYVPGQDVFNLKKFKKTQTPTQVATTPDTYQEDDVNVEQINSSPIVNRNGWSRNATLNFANAFLANRYNGQPYMPTVDYQTPDYVLPDYSQAVSNVLSGMSAVGRQASDTMAGPQAFNATLGAMGQGLDQVTGIQAQWNNAGVGIANQAYDRAAGIYNQFSPMKAKINAQYNDDIQTLGQQRVNSDNAYRSNVLKSVISANQEEENMQALKTMFPQVGIDNWNREIGWSGTGRNPFQYDPYTNPMGNSLSNNSMTDANDAYDQAYNHAIKRMSPENAQKYASDYSLAVAKKQMSESGFGYGTNTASDVYSAMFGNND